jgi:hypothetical protein
MKIINTNDGLCFFSLCLFVHCTIIFFFVFSFLHMYIYIYSGIYLLSLSLCIIEIAYVFRVYVHNPSAYKNIHTHKLSIFDYYYYQIQVRTFANYYCVLLLVCFVSFFLRCRTLELKLYTPRVCFMTRFFLYLGKKNIIRNSVEQKNK